MTCVHLRKLFDLCQQHDMKLAGSDLIHITCRECGEKEVCPATLMDELNDQADDQPGDEASDDGE